jgi:hypothetical protein
MRNKESLFNRVCEFINLHAPGDTYKASSLTAWCDGYERVTSYKRWNKNPFERTRKYQTMLKYSGIVTNVKRGEWKVNLQIPDWFTLAHANIMCGYSTSSRSKKTSDGTWVQTNYRRVNMTKAEIMDKLKFHKVAFHANPLTKVVIVEKELSSPAYTDPMHYASGDYAKEKELTAKNMPVAGSANVSQTFAPSFSKSTATQIVINSTYGANASEHPMAKAEKITREESEFFKTEDSIKERNQLVENLRENAGLLKAATQIMDQVQILDPLVQGRVVNIFEQLKALTETVGSRIEYNRTKQII